MINKKELKNLFVVGPGRSGTSLMHAILGVHSNVVPIKESPEIRSILRGKSNELDKKEKINKVLNAKINNDKKLINFRYKVYKDPLLILFVPELIDIAESRN